MDSPRASPAAPATRRPTRLLVTAGLVASAALIALMVLTPTPELPGRAITELSRMLTVVPGVDGGSRTSNWVEAGLNVLLFVPLGVVLAVPRPRRGVWWATGIGFWVSVAVETAQGLFLSGRTAEAADVIANASGTSVGYLLVVVLVRIVRPSAR